MLHLLFAAALFTPPTGFHYLPRDPAMSAQLKRSGTEFIAEYRLEVRQSIGSVLASRSIVITIGKASNTYGLDAGGYAQARIALLTRRSAIDVLENSVSLCGGQRGLLLSIKKNGSDERVSQLYAGNDPVYVATLTYPHSVDDHGARQALTTLCPPSAAAHADPGPPLPFTLPAGWSHGSISAMGTVSPPLVPIGLWLHLAAHSAFLESLSLVRGPALQADVTPEEESEAMLSYMKQNVAGFSLKDSHAQSLCKGVDGWYASYQLPSRGHTIAVEQVFAYTSDASYIMRYSRKSGDPEDPSARKALDSLCPALPASPSPILSPSPSAVPTATP